MNMEDILASDDPGAVAQIQSFGSEHSSDRAGRSPRGRHQFTCEVFG
jgi:hypothetical protein